MKLETGWISKYIKEENKKFFLLCYDSTVKDFTVYYNMNVDRTELLLSTFIKSVYEKKIFDITYSTSLDDLKLIQKQFDSIIDNKGFVFTLADGLKTGLVAPCLTSPNAFKDLPPINLWKLFSSSTEKVFTNISDIPKEVGKSVGGFFDELLTNKILIVLIIIGIIFFGFIYGKSKQLL